MAKSQWRALTDLKAKALVPWSRENLFRCDPYLVWADVTTDCDTKSELEAMPELGINPGLNVAVLIELVAACDLGELLQRLNQDATGPEQVRFQLNGVEPFPPSRFVTGLVDRRGLAALVTEVLSRRIKRFALQDSRVDIAEAIQYAHLHLAKETQTKGATPAMSAVREVDSPRNNPSTGTYLGIIDNGLPVLRLRDAIQFVEYPPAHFWDQGWQPPHLAGTGTGLGAPESDDRYWDKCWEPQLSTIGGIPIPVPRRGFFYGRRLKRLETGAARENDQEEYFLSNYFSPPPRETHGAGVLGLLAP